jgi:excisionase family DNA binding protein
MAESSTEDDEILTVRQVSNLLKLHQRTVYKLAEKGTLPGRQIGTNWRFLKSDIMKRFAKTESVEKAKPKQKTAPAQRKRKTASSDS